MAAFDAEILPGKAGKVTAQLATENYRGAVDKAITVTSNDPKNGTTVLHLKATIVGSVEVLPRMFLGFPSYPLWDFSAKLLVRKVKSETGELKITDLTSTAPWLTTRSRKVEKPEPEADGLPALVPGDWVIDIEVSETAPPGQSSQQSVKFKTGLTREPVITIPVAVALQQAMQAVPPVPGRDRSGGDPRNLDDLRPGRAPRDRQAGDQGGGLAGAVHRDDAARKQTGATRSRSSGRGSATTP